MNLLRFVGLRPLLPVVVAIGGCAKPGNVDPAAEALAIRDRDVAAVTAFYTFDAIVLDPETPARRGAEAMRAAWQEFLKSPGLTVRLVPEKIDIAAAGDLASDFGRFEVHGAGPAGKIKTVHKYLTVWRKVGGEWKILYTAWNTNPPGPRS